MTLGKARRSLALLWIVSFGAMFVIVLLMTIFGRFGERWDLPWNWFLPLTCPTVGLILSLISVSTDHRSSQLLDSSNIFWFSISLSTLYLLAIYAIVFIHPFTNVSFELLISRSTWFLGPIQGLVCGVIGKLFIDNA